MAARFEHRGAGQARRQLRALALNFPRKAMKGLRHWGEKVMTDSRENYCPVRRGTLKDSGHVAPVPGRIAIDLVYGGPARAYASIVHETHKTKRKYLEKPLMIHLKTLREDVIKYGKVTEADLR